MWRIIAPCVISVYEPCPVDIDFGDVSMNMRNLLRKMGQKKFNPVPVPRCSSWNATDPATINATPSDGGLGL